MASMQVNEDGGYAVPKDMVGKGNEYAQPVLDKPPGGGKSKLRKQREQQLAMQKGEYYMTPRWCVTFPRTYVLFFLDSLPTPIHHLSSKK